MYWDFSGLEHQDHKDDSNTQQGMESLNWKFSKRK
nr:MAG TPA: hypothetical protein [Caudoviricetes sp.]